MLTSNLAVLELVDVHGRNTDFISHVDFAEVHVIKHFLCSWFPHLFIAGMPEQTHTNDDATFKRQTFLDFNELLLSIPLYILSISLAT